MLNDLATKLAELTGTPADKIRGVLSKELAPIEETITLADQAEGLLDKMLPKLVAGRDVGLYTTDADYIWSGLNRTRLLAGRELP